MLLGAKLAFSSTQCVNISLQNFSILSDLVLSLVTYDWSLLLLLCYLRQKKGMVSFKRRGILSFVLLVIGIVLVLLQVLLINQQLLLVYLRYLFWIQISKGDKEWIMSLVADK